MSHWQSALILYVCALLCVSAQSYIRDTANKSNKNISNYLLPVYAVASTASFLNLTICRKELQNFRDAVDQRILWSLKILDSSGEFKSGFLYGNNYWLGSRNQCYDTMNRIPLDIMEKDLLNNTRYRDPQKEFPPFKVHYLIAYFKHNSTLQYHVNVINENIITLGLCLPASCSASELSFILEKIFYDRSLLINDIYSADFTLIKVKDLEDNYQWIFSGPSLLICIVLVLTVSMMVIGTIYDIFIYQKHLSMKKKNINIEKLRQEMEFTASSNEGNKFGKIIMCFSIYTNTKIICDTKLNANSIPIIHGLRFLTMVWIMIAHSLLYTLSYIDNKIWAWRMSENFISQIISNASLGVDTYFFQSGFLIAYLYLSNTRNKEQTNAINYRTKLNEFFVFLIKRFIRLTPAYMLTLGIILLTATSFDKTSQFYMNERPQETCAKYWWRNLLYINNLFNHKNMCMNWTWYLANDMQFFIIGLALLILSSTFFYTSVIILGILLIGSITLTGYISYVYQYVPIISELYNILNALYMPPWTRINPYIIGMITGYILIRLNNKLVLKRSIIMLCWCFASICNIVVLFGLYDRHISVLSNAVYVALSRTVWAIGIAWILIACCTKHGGIVNKILSFKVWIPVSKLTYCAYLLNPFLMELFHLHSETSFHVEFVTVLITYLGYIMITFICAYMLTLMAETPYVLLLRMFMQSRNMKKHKLQTITIS